jgi:translation initiation factor IF-2
VPIRIYALAKQLKLDNKILVDICKRAGVTGKGSALASLSDEELAQVTAYMEKTASNRPAARPGRGQEPGQPQAIRREDYIAPGGAAGRKIPVLESRPPEKPKPKSGPKPPAVSPEPPRTEPKTEPPPVKQPVAVEVVEKPFERPLEKPKSIEKLPPLETAKKREKDKLQPEGKPETPKQPEKTGPMVKLAPMPVHAAPKKKEPEEPAPQKPDIKLPPDVLAASKGGGKPLSEHLRKHEKRKAAGKKTSPRKQGEEGELEQPEQPLRSRTRARRPARTEEAEKESDAPTLGGREARQLKRKRAGAAKRRRQSEEEERTVARRRTHIVRTGANTAAPRKERVALEVPCTVRDFSEAVGVPARIILGKLLELGMMVNITSALDPDSAELLAAGLGVEIDFQKEVALEERLLASLQREDDPESLAPRPPVVTFLGHVDHGKTSLLDRIIHIDVASGEKGGITQYIRAYRIERNGQAVAFVDTPGHEAFTEMRARGANVTDIAVLVVAADDGVMPQTEEAISHARAAHVPIVVALNKIDLPGVNEQRAYEQLAANELLPTEWGGDTEVIKTSAVTGQGIDDLMETLLTVAELHELKANPQRKGAGTCLEAELHEGRGVIAKLLVQNGTMRVGDVLVCGPAFGRVKAMYDTLDADRKLDEAPPSTPVNVTGLNVPPGAGDHFYVLDDISEARALAEHRASEARQKELLGPRPRVTLETLMERLDRQEVQTLNIILRADVRGSIEAIRKELTKLQHPEVEIKVLQATVGGVTEADVHLADASDAVIIGFNVVPDEGARQLAEARGVQIRRYDIIYQVTEDLKAALEGMLKPEQRAKELGRALIKQTFQISRLGTIAGCQVISGVIQRDSRVRVIRDSRIIGEYPLESLRREKDDVREVRAGLECGMKLKGFNDLKEGDILEVYKIEEIRRTFDNEPAAQ